MAVTLTILAENKVNLGVGLIGEHGFAAWLDTGEKKILWDTGQGFCLPHNAARLGADLSKADVAAISHGHFDHTGGLAHAAQARPGLDVHCHPACFEAKRTRRNFFGKDIVVPIGLPTPREELEKAGMKFIEVKDHAEIAPGVHFFAEIKQTTDFEKIEPGFFIQDPAGDRPDPFEDDACLAIETERGVSVLLGCAHRGIVNTLRHVKDRLGVDGFYSVWGGTHMIERSESEVASTIAALQDLKAERLAAAHCTGFANEMRLAQAFPKTFTVIGVGLRAEI